MRFHPDLFLLGASRCHRAVSECGRYAINAVAVRGRRYYEIEQRLVGEGGGYLDGGVQLGSQFESAEQARAALLIYDRSVAGDR